MIVSADQNEVDDSDIILPPDWGNISGRNVLWWNPRWHLRHVWWDRGWRNLERDWKKGYWSGYQIWGLACPGNLRHVQKWGWGSKIRFVFKEIPQNPPTYDSYLVSPVDPCTKIHCSAGKTCLAKGGEARCVCINECPEETDPRRKVCTNRNETWPSDCEVHRQRCLCDSKDALCTDPDISHIHIDYYGECREMPVRDFFKKIYNSLNFFQVFCNQKLGDIN